MLMVLSGVCSSICRYRTQTSLPVERHTMLVKNDYSRMSISNFLKTKY